MNIILKKEWAGFPVGKALTVNDNRGVYLKELGVAEPDKLKQPVTENPEKTVKMKKKKPEKTAKK